MPLFLSVDAFLGFTQNSLKSSLKPLASFQKGFVKIWEMFQPIGREVINSKENSACTPSFHKCFQNSIAFGAKRIRNDKFDII
jgi:hypothetical protein